MHVPVPESMAGGAVAVERTRVESAFFYHDRRAIGPSPGRSDSMGSPFPQPSLFEGPDRTEDVATVLLSLERERLAALASLVERMATQRMPSRHRRPQGKVRGNGKGTSLAE
jgi:hypothetical protein